MTTRLAALIGRLRADQRVRRAGVGELSLGPTRFVARGSRGAPIAGFQPIVVDAKDEASRRPFRRWVPAFPSAARGACFFLRPSGGRAVADSREICGLKPTRTIPGVRRTRRLLHEAATIASPYRPDAKERSRMPSPRAVLRFTPVRRSLFFG